MAAPTNLSPAAIDDYARALLESEQFGSRVAARTELQLDRICKEIAHGRGLGHKRQDVTTRNRILFRNMPPSPLVIAYDADTKMVIRIMHGAAEFPALFRND